MDIVDIPAALASAEEKRRLALYERFANFFKGRHRGLFHYLGSTCEYEKGLQRKIYLTCNLAGLITRASADLLFGETPTILAGGEDPGSELSLTLNELLQQNHIARTLYRSGLANCYRGDAVYRIRDNGKRIVIEDIPAHQYFVRLSIDSCREVEAQAIVWRVCLGDRHYIRAEQHMQGTILQQAWRCSKDSTDKMIACGLAEIYGDMAPPELQATGIESPLVYHVPNQDLDDEYWGLSDYADLDSLFEAVNNRLSKIDAYLDKHSSPKLIGLPGMSDPEGNFAQNQDYIEPMDPEVGAKLPRYVTWEGQMSAAFMEIDRLSDAVFMTSEISKALFQTAPGQRFESAQAMKTAITGTLNKIKRKATLYDQQLKQLFATALELNAVRYQGPKPDGSRIDIVWKDGIPQDYLGSIQAESQRVDSQLSSRLSAIMRIDRCSPEQAQEELARLSAEQQTPATGDTTPATGDTTPTTGDAPATGRDLGVNSNATRANGTEPTGPGSEQYSNT